MTIARTRLALALGITLPAGAFPMKKAARRRLFKFLHPWLAQGQPGNQKL
jgi:hypothetical protein